MKITLDRDLADHVRTMAEHNGIDPEKYANNLLELGMKIEASQNPSRHPNHEGSNCCCCGQPAETHSGCDCLAQKGVKPMTTALMNKKDAEALHIAIERETSYHYARIKCIEETALKLAEAAARLRAFGFDVRISSASDPCYLTVDVEKESLPRVRKALGHRLAYYDMVPYDCKKRIVRKKLKCDPYPGLTISFLAKLPRGSKCKIKTVIQRRAPWKEKKVVCEA